VKSFQSELLINYPRISHTFFSRRYSIQSLLAKHLDEPLDKFLSTYYGNRYRDFFADFKLSEISTKFNCETDLTPYQKVSYSLDYWSNEIFRFSYKLDLGDEDPQKYCFSKDINEKLLPTHNYSEFSTFDKSKVIPSLQNQFYGTIDTLRFLIENLKKIKPTVFSASVSSSSRLEKLITSRRNPKDANESCDLCWRKTERYKLRNNINHNNLINSSARFCEKHAVNGKGRYSENWSNYIKGRRYKERYLEEIDNILSNDSNKDKARYLVKISILKKTFEEQQGFSFNDDGKMALAYYLVRSGLDNDGYRRIYKAKIKDGLSNAQIAKKFKISRQAVGQTIRKIELKLHEVHKKAKAAEDSIINRQ